MQTLRLVAGRSPEAPHSPPTPLTQLLADKDWKAMDLFSVSSRAHNEAVACSVFILKRSVTMAPVLPVLRRPRKSWGLEHHGGLSIKGLKYRC